MILQTTKSMSEILNIEHHYRLLAIKALNKFKDHREAAKAMGITVRTLSRWKKKFKIIQ